MLARTSLIGAITLATTLTLSAAASAQGLAPPPPLAPEEREDASSTERDLDNSQKSDSKRGLEWLYVDVNGGMQIVGLRTFNLDEETFSAGFVETESEGFVMGAGVGLRLVFLTFGARARVGFFDSWDLFSVGGEMGLRLPFGNLEPHFELGGGYTALGSFKSSLQSGAVQSALDHTDIAGFYVRAGGGVDYYITPMFSIGALASFEVLGLTRPGLDPSKITEIKADPNLSDLQKKKADLLAFEGTSYGAAGTAMAVVGLHF
ncbi:MAG: hypothetical protein IPM54_03510 [Polyangiaceae bacterium]|nr:hypothetical protein [Polyangiaceae bacterium]